MLTAGRCLGRRSDRATAPAPSASPQSVVSRSCSEATRCPSRSTVGLLHRIRWGRAAEGWVRRCPERSHSRWSPVTAPRPARVLRRAAGGIAQGLERGEALDWACAEGRSASTTRRPAVAANSAEVDAVCSRCASDHPRMLCDLAARSRHLSLCGPENSSLSF